MASPHTKDFDAVVIGSGAGGLSAALALATAGLKVGVFEQHFLPGGYSQGFTREGYTFSPGVHYIGGLGEGGNLRRIYEGLGVANDLTFFEINPDGYDCATIGGYRFDFPAGRERLIAALERAFPGEAAGIKSYIDVVLRISDEIGRCLPARSLREKLTLPVRMPTLSRHGLRPLGKTVAKYVDDPMLRAVLTIQSGDHGMAPSRAPTALHAALVGYYIDGGCYPKGGAGSIAAAFIKGLNARGGSIELKAKVEEILVEGRRAVGIRLADGRDVYAPIVVSNADPGVTWGELVRAEHVSRRLRRRVARTKYCVSTVSLFLAVDMDLRAAGLDSGNRWFSRTPDIDAAYDYARRTDLWEAGDIPALFLSATTLKDPTLRHDGIHTIEAISLAGYEAFGQWESRASGGLAPQDYVRLKSVLKERMLDAVGEIVSGVRERVVFAELGTPLTNKRIVNASGGAMYGTEKSLGNLGPLSFAVKSEIEGLFQCGASTLSAGVLGVTTSGLVAAQEALGCDYDDLLTAKGQSVRIYSSEPDRDSGESDLSNRRANRR